MACLKAIEKSFRSLSFGFTSDHIIEDINTFIKVIDKALDDVKKEMKLSSNTSSFKPETGFGYIESEKELDNN